MTAARVALLVALAAAGPAAAAGPPAGEGGILKEPAYRTRAPRYCLLQFGPGAKDRVWLVHDGDTLYVDRNGNGDLTEPDEKVAAKAHKPRDGGEPGYEFEAGDLRLGGRVHKGLSVWATPATRYGEDLCALPNLKAALDADPKARVYGVSLDVDWPGLKGLGVGERVSQSAGVQDGGGALLFAAKQAEAPAVHFGGPLQVTFYAARPTLKLGRSGDVVLVVGTPGRGPGTFAMLAYEGTIPDEANPRVEIVFPAAKEGTPAVRELYELKQRC
jgi:hypothetical protein